MEPPSKQNAPAPKQRSEGKSPEPQEDPMTKTHNSATRRKRSALPGGVRQLKSKRWQVRVQAPDGGRIPVGTYATRTDAEVALARHVSEIDSGSWRDPRTTTPTITELGDAWFARRTADALDPDVNLREATVIEERGIWDLMVVPHLGHIEVANLSYEDVLAWFDLMRSTRDDNAKTRKTRSINRIKKPLSMIRRVLRDAQRAGQVETNVAELVELPKSAPKETKYCMSLPQVAAVAAVLDEMVPEYNAQQAKLPGRQPAAASFKPGLFVSMMVLCGAMRFGEAAGLRVGDVRDGRIRIERSFRKGEITKPKTYAGIRTVGVSEQISVALAVHVADRDADEPLFTLPNGSRLDSNNFRGRWWIPAVKRAGLEPSIRLHDLRHTGVSLALAAGVPATDVAKWCGHASPLTTMSIYAHGLPGRENAVTLALDAMGEGNVLPMHRVLWSS